MSSEKVTRGRWHLSDSTCPSRSSSLLQDKGPGLVSLGAPGLPTCQHSPPPPAFLSIGLSLSQRHSPGPASFSCCHHHWPLRMKDLVSSSTMRRRVVNPRDRYPDVAMVAIYARVKEETGQVEGCALWSKPCSASTEVWF